MPTKVRQLSLFKDEAINNMENYFDKLLAFLDINDDISGWTDYFGESLHEWASTEIKKPIRTLSLFSGGGGLDIAFHDAGFNILQMVEIDPRFFQTLSSNAKEDGYFKQSEPVCIDIREFDPPADLEVDFIIGGPPCQTFSAAGRRAAGVSGIDDPRGTLFQEYVRILEKLQPKGFLFENVYGILGAQGGKPWELIVESFKEVGYNISYRILDTADYGVPQHRERLIIVGTKDKKFLFPRPTHGPDSLNNRKFYTPELAVANIDIDTTENIGGKYGYLLEDIPPGLNYSFYTENMGHPNPVFAWRSKFSDFLYKADPEVPVRTLKAQGGKYTGPFHWNSRSFDVKELKRLQTFPDKYEFCGSKQATIMQIGNSVPPHFGRMLAIAVLDQIFNIKLPFDIGYLSEEEELGFRKRKRKLSAVYKEKAQKAIENLKGNKKYSRIEEVYANNTFNELIFVRLESNFNLVVKSTDDISLNIRCMFEGDKDSLNVIVSPKGEENEEHNDSLIIELGPLKEWNIPYRQVNLKIYGTDDTLYTVAWKMFEYYIVKNGYKADLVQLNGYYQYSPQIICREVKFVGEYYNESYDIIKNILQGECVRRIVSIEELSTNFQLSTEQVVEELIKLRNLGYEVRSEYTNNQIPTGHVLIPYIFPTLSPQSVQLRKQLFPLEMATLNEYK